MKCIWLYLGIRMLSGELQLPIGSLAWLWPIMDNVVDQLFRSAYHLQHSNSIQDYGMLALRHI